MAKYSIQDLKHFHFICADADYMVLRRMHDDGKATEMRVPKWYLNIEEIKNEIEFPKFKTIPPMPNFISTLDDSYMVSSTYEPEKLGTYPYAGYNKQCNIEDVFTVTIISYSFILADFEKYGYVIFEDPSSHMVHYIKKEFLNEFQIIKASTKHNPDIVPEDPYFLVHKGLRFCAAGIKGDIIKFAQKYDLKNILLKLIL